jgi:hypothetical protein
MMSTSKEAMIVSSLLQPLRPSASRPWNKFLAAHLLNRAGFGGRPEDIARALDWGLPRTVDYLVDYEAVPDPFEPPDLPEGNEGAIRAMKGISADQRRAMQDEFRRENTQAVGRLRGWWISRMLHTKRPLQEKMTLFWHGHFTSSIEDVRLARHMYTQNQLLRQNCLGNFKQLVLDISRDPAMLRYLDNNTNRKGRPNENYARELLELFTMGIDNYTEEDIKEAARAFTGWTFRGDEFVFNRAQHDDGEKTFLGETGRFDGTDIIDIIFRQPVTARWICRRLVEFFAYENPEPELIEAMAELLRRNNYEIRPLMRALLQSEAFYSARAYRTQIKSPAHLIVGSVRYLEVRTSETSLAAAMRLLGQELFNPPTVKGWDGGETWINTTTLFLRYNLSRFLVMGRMPSESELRRGIAAARQAQRRQQPAFRNIEPAICRVFGPDTAARPEQLVDGLVDRLLQSPIPAHTRKWLAEQAARLPLSERTIVVAHMIMSMPDYQLC